MTAAGKPMWATRGALIHERAPEYNGRPSDRCQELACAYPSATPGGLCRFHRLMRDGKIPRSRPRISEQNVTVGRGCA